MHQLCDFWGDQNYYLNELFFSIVSSYIIKQIITSIIMKKTIHVSHPACILIFLFYFHLIYIVVVSYNKITSFLFSKWIVHFLIFTLISRVKNMENGLLRYVNTDKIKNHEETNSWFKSKRRKYLSDEEFEDWMMISCGVCGKW